MDNIELLKYFSDISFRQVEMMAYIESLIEDYAELITSTESAKQEVYTRIMVKAQMKIEELRNQRT